MGYIYFSSRIRSLTSVYTFPPTSHVYGPTLKPSSSDDFAFWFSGQTLFSTFVYILVEGFPPPFLRNTVTWYTHSTIVLFLVVFLVQFLDIDNFLVRRNETEMLSNSSYLMSYYQEQGSVSCIYV